MAWGICRNSGGGNDTVVATYSKQWGYGIFYSIVKRNLTVSFQSNNGAFENEWIKIQGLKVTIKQTGKYNLTIATNVSGGTGVTNINLVKAEITAGTVYSSTDYSYNYSNLIYAEKLV